MYLKDGLPEDGEFVICTVKNLEQHRARVSLDEYKNLEGMVHSSEISRKWIRNLKTYMKPGKKLICRVMEVDSKRRHVNLSVRRVGNSQAMMKQRDWKNEKTADDLLKTVANLGKMKYELVFDKIGKPILKKYGKIYPFLQEMALNPDIIKELKLEPKLKKVFSEVIGKRMKIPKAQIKAILTLSSEKSDGLLVIKKVVKNAEALAKKNNAELTITYAGAPKYNLKFESPDLKDGGKILEKIVNYMEKEILANQGAINFKRR